MAGEMNEFHRKNGATAQAAMNAWSAVKHDSAEAMAKVKQIEVVKSKAPLTGRGDPA